MNEVKGENFRKEFQRTRRTGLEKGKADLVANGVRVPVLQLSHMYPNPLDPLYGMAVHRPVSALRAASWDVPVIAPIPWVPPLAARLDPRWAAYARAPRMANLDGVEVFHPRMISLPRGLWMHGAGHRLYWAVRKLVRKLHSMRHFAVIHAHMGIPDGHAALLLTHDLSIPLITTFRGSDVDLYWEASANCKNVLREVARRSTRVIAPTPRLRDKIHALTGVEATVVENGVDGLEEVLSAHHSDIAVRDVGERRLLSVSRLVPDKRIDLVLQALNALRHSYPGVIYRVVGDGPERPRLESMVAELGLQGHVEFLGLLDRREVNTQYAWCDVFCLPSIRETFGLVYVEAMAHGRPIIACRNQGIDGIAVDGVHGIMVAPGSVAELQVAMDRLLANPAWARKLGVNARGIAASFTWQRTADRMNGVYESVLSGGKS